MFEKLKKKREEYNNQKRLITVEKYIDYVMNAGRLDKALKYVAETNLNGFEIISISEEEDIIRKGNFIFIFGIDKELNVKIPFVYIIKNLDILLKYYSDENNIEDIDEDIDALLVCEPKYNPFIEEPSLVYCCKGKIEETLVDVFCDAINYYDSEDNLEARTIIDKEKRIKEFEDLI